MTLQQALTDLFAAAWGSWGSQLVENKVENKSPNKEIQRVCGQLS